MKAVTVLACCLLVFPLVGTVPSHLPELRTKLSVPSADLKIRRAPITALFRKGSELFRSGQYGEALQVFGAMRTTAEAEQFGDLAARAAGNIGACEFALHRYRDALQAFLEAHRMADAAGDLSAAAVFDANIASLYSEIGDLDAASQWTADALSRLSPKDRRTAEPRLLIQFASLRARQKRMPEAEALFARGLDAADRAADLQLYANGLNRLGEEYLKQHNLKNAEPPLLEAYRIRKLNRFALDSSYRNLGLLRMEQGDLPAASLLLDRAIELAARPEGPLPNWDVFHQRGRIRLAQGRLREALDDLRVAVRLARDWRWNAPSDDAARIGTEGWLEKVHSALVEAGNRLYLETRNPKLVGETFEAAEENRAASLRVLLASSRDSEAASLPPAYWATLGRLQQAEVQALRNPQSPAIEQVAAIRAELTRMELALGHEGAPLPTGLLDRTRNALDGATALLSFHLGESVSWMWALDVEGPVLYRLPPRVEIESQVRAAADAIRTDAPTAGATSEGLYRTLFGALDARFKRKTRWLVALDKGLFEAPLAALRVDGRYLAELHAVEIIPGAGAWVEAAARAPSPTHLFVGLGDAVYNTADVRYHKPPGLSAAKALLLPRLVGSGREIENCARAWGGASVLLTGQDASRGKLQEQLARDPAIVHLATHVLESSSQPAHGLIALSLSPQRENQLLSPQEIAGWRTRAGVIVMSGCHSAEGPILPGTGLLGLTRAWLVAGARSVVASNWATPDESGTLFSALYRHLSADQVSGPAAALRAAQLEMLRSGGWRAQPRYWGAYFVMGTQ